MTQPPSTPTFALTRVAPVGLLLAWIVMLVGFVLYHRDVVVWMNESMWGLPAVPAYLLAGVAFVVLGFEATRRTTFAADERARTVTFSRYTLWVYRFGRQEAKFSDIRYIDIHHTGEMSTAGVPSVSEIISPEGRPFGYRLWVNGLSPTMWLFDWLLTGVPYSGAAELKVRLQDGTEWLVLKCGSVDHVVACADELKRITGARIT